MQQPGDLEKAEGKWRLRFVRSLAHSPDKVWRALTEPEHLAAWFPSEVKGVRAEGAKLAFVFPHGEAPTMEGRMLKYDPPRLLEFAWGEDTLRFELRPEGDGTLLIFRDTIVEVGKAARDGAGWQVCLIALELELAGAPEARAAMERWDEFSQQYRDRFGSEASTIGPPETMLK